MTEKVSPFVESNRPWIIRKTVADYLRARNIFVNMEREINSEHFVSFEQLKKLTEILFTLKENLHLIYKRLIDPKTNSFEKAEKYTPNKEEIEFSNNIGLLFHKTMAARELKYVMEHYSTDSDDYALSRESLDSYLQKIRQLFNDGIDLIKKLLFDYCNNVIVLSYLLENDRYVEECLNESTNQLLARMFGKDAVDDAYVRVGQYCLESGWQDRARRSFGEALKINPKNAEAKKYLSK